MCFQSIKQKWANKRFQPTTSLTCARFAAAEARAVGRRVAAEGPLGSGSSVLFSLVSCGQDNQSFRLRQPTSENAGGIQPPAFGTNAWGARSNLQLGFDLGQLVPGQRKVADVFLDDQVEGKSRRGFEQADEVILGVEGNENVLDDFLETNV